MHTEANMLELVELFGKEIVNIRNRINMHSKHEKGNETQQKYSEQRQRPQENVRRNFCHLFARNELYSKLKLNLNPAWLREYERMCATAQ